MKEKILVYRWGSLMEPSLLRTLKDMGTDCVEFSMRLTDYHADAAFAGELIEKLHKEKPDAVFSYDYFPILSMLCEINRIPYLSWIYDCPQYTLLSGTVSSPVNHIFCFDALYTEKIRAYGAGHVYHFPLAADVKGFGKTLGTNAVRPAAAAGSEISFVGSLYNGEGNRLRGAALSEYAKGYVEGLIQSQLKVYGYNLLADSMKEDVAQEIVAGCSLSLSGNYIQQPLQLAADAVGMEVSAREREQTLALLGQYYPVMLYTASEIPAQWKGQEKIRYGGYADYENKMPFVFRDSAVSLNITSKTIASGIPQRVLDIMACGGCCLTNRQPEIEEYFSDEEELLMYSGMEELMEKTDYYLKHEDERRRIAQNGYERVKKDFSLDKRMQEMLGFLF